MKNFIKPLLMAIVLIVSMNACKKINPTDDITFVINSDIYRSPVLVKFINANPNSTTQPGYNATSPEATYKVGITGTEAKYIVMNDGDTSLKASRGFLQFSIGSNRVPSATSPISFTLDVTFPGFARVNKTFYITDTLEKSIEVYVQELASPAPGSSIVDATDVLSATQPTVIQTSTNATMTEATKITIPEGTVLKDASGNTINSNNLHSTVIHYGIGDEASLRAFPGGLQTRNAVDKNGNKIDSVIDFITAGCLQINMQAGGKEVRQFSKPLEVEVDINPSFYNAYSADGKLKEGDSIPVWSMEEGSGQWVLEGEAPVIVKNNKLVAKFSASHLSVWNLDYWANSTSYYYRYGRWYPVKLPTCNNVATINLQSAPDNFTGNVYLDMFDQIGNKLTWGSSYYPIAMVNGKASIVADFRGRVAIPSATIKAYATAYGKSVNASSTFSPCSQSSVTVTLPITRPAPTSSINLSVDIAAFCSNKNLKVNYSGWVYMFDNSATQWWNAWTYKYIVAGQPAYFNNLKENGNYTFYAWNGSWYSTQVVLKKQDEAKWGNLPATGAVEASAKYDAASNTLKVTGIYKIKCK